MKAYLLTLVLVDLSMGLILAPALDAQPLAEGDRLRLTMASSPGSPIVGRVERIRGDTLMVDRDDWSHLQSVMLGDVQHVERSIRSRSHAVEGTLLGALIGGVGVYGVCKLTEEEPAPGEWDIIGCEVAFVPGLALGALLGLAVGASTRTDEWEEVPRDVYATLDLRRGVGVRLRIGW